MLLLPLRCLSSCIRIARLDFVGPPHSLFEKGGDESVGGGGHVRVRREGESEVVAVSRGGCTACLYVVHFFLIDWNVKAANKNNATGEEEGQWYEVGMRGIG